MSCLLRRHHKLVGPRFLQNEEAREGAAMEGCSLCFHSSSPELVDLAVFKSSKVRLAAEDVVACVGT